MNYSVCQGAICRAEWLLGLFLEFQDESGQIANRIYLVHSYS